MAVKTKTVTNKVTIKIPRPLYEKIGQVIDESGYDSVTDFVVYILRDLVASHEMRVEIAEGEQGDMERVKQRLRALGYL